ncbi:MAG: hypothetical protein JXR94_17290 [Candidatus Hydrogenedentes bacterium]|nr:hypothetical protein [Candidatus Hydrogenedentota bacterium]
MRNTAYPWAVLGCVLLSSACSAEQGREELAFETHDGGIFTIQKPKGWELITAGAGPTLSFLARDPRTPARQVFFFGQVGPFYLSEQQRQIDQQYMNMAGFPVAYADAPTVDPLTPSTFVARFNAVAQMQSAQQFMPQCPRLENLQVVSATPERNVLQQMIPGSVSEVVRAVFTRDGALAEGMFSATVFPFMPFTGSVGGGTGAALCFCGITAPKEEFDGLHDDLLKCLRSFTISEAYARQWIAQSQGQGPDPTSISKTLSDTSDMIMEGWENRSRTEDVLAERRSDTILGRERLHDPGSGQVYWVPNGFYEDYDRNRERFDMRDLQLVPEADHDAWMSVPMAGEGSIH